VATGNVRAANAIGRKSSDGCDRSVLRHRSAPLIRRDDQSDWLIIPQIEHARIAGELARAWGNERSASFDSYPGLLFGVEHHDDGWRDWDAAPRINPATGMPRSFMEMRMRDSTAIWTESIAICSTEPLAGIAVSRHFCYLAEQVRNGGRADADDFNSVEQFLLEQKEVETSLAQQADAEFSSQREKLEGAFDLGFRAVRFFDAVSLWLCCTERREPAGIRTPTGESIRLVPKRLLQIAIDPYPFGVTTLKVAAPARRIAARKYENDAEFQAAFSTAPIELLTWSIQPG
jgi:uncharacterized protein DUF3891